MLTRLIYTSHFARDMAYVDIHNILMASRRNNPELEITGLLCHGNQTFLQYIEGTDENVNATYNRIALDDRHKSIRMLHRSSTKRRYFDHWSMGYVSISDPQIMQMLEEKTGINIFQTDNLTGSQALAVLGRLKVMLDLQG